MRHHLKDKEPARPNKTAASWSLPSNSSYDNVIHAALESADVPGADVPDADSIYNRVQDHLAELDAGLNMPLADILSLVEQHMESAAQDGYAPRPTDLSLLQPVVPNARFEMLGHVAAKLAECRSHARYALFVLCIICRWLKWNQGESTIQMVRTLVHEEYDSISVPVPLSGCGAPQRAQAIVNAVLEMHRIRGMNDGQIDKIMEHGQKYRDDEVWIPLPPIRGDLVPTNWPLSGRHDRLTAKWTDQQCIDEIHFSLPLREHAQSALYERYNSSMVATTYGELVRIGYPEVCRETAEDIAADKLASLLTETLKHSRLHLIGTQSRRPGRAPPAVAPTCRHAARAAYRIAMRPLSPAPPRQSQTIGTDGKPPSPRQQFIATLKEAARRQRKNGKVGLARECMQSGCPNSLSGDERTAIEAHYFRGATFADIASTRRANAKGATNTEASWKSKCSRGLVKLARWIAHRLGVRMAPNAPKDELFRKLCAVLRAKGTAILSFVFRPCGLRSHDRRQPWDEW